MPNALVSDFHMSVRLLKKFFQLLQWKNKRVTVDGGLQFIDGIKYALNKLELGLVNLKLDLVGKWPIYNPGEKVALLNCIGYLHSKIPHPNMYRDYFDEIWAISIPIWYRLYHMACEWLFWVSEWSDVRTISVPFCAQGFWLEQYSKDEKLFNKTVFNRFLPICLSVLSLSTMNLIPT